MRPLLSQLSKFLSIIKQKNLTDFSQASRIGETCEVKPAGIREVKSPDKSMKDEPMNMKQINQCPYCNGKQIIKRGKRKKKYEIAQLYYCNHCKKSFTAPRAKGRSFPLRVVLEGLCLYNIGYSAEESCRLLKEQFGLDVSPRTLRDWVHDYASLCRYARLRPYAMKLYSSHQTIQTAHLYHRQVYDFSVHRSKLALILQEHRHARFGNLREFLEAIQAECPHQFFQDGIRASEMKIDFEIQDVRLMQKSNFANRIADLALQAVDDNKLRHLTLQKFMLANDSVTVATEVPVYMDKYDIEHMQEVLKFRIPLRLDRVLTGHIDILQIRNGAVHILDYKPNASKGKAHSKRFDERQASLSLLEDVMSLCNDAVVFLEQIRDIYAEDVDSVIFNDITKEYFYSRRKIFNLFKAWKRMDEGYEKRNR